MALFPLEMDIFPREYCFVEIFFSKINSSTLDFEFQIFLWMNHPFDDIEQIIIEIIDCYYVISRRIISFITNNSIWVFEILLLSLAYFRWESVNLKWHDSFLKCLKYICSLTTHQLNFVVVNSLKEKFHCRFWQIGIYPFRVSKMGNTNILLRKYMSVKCTY